MQIKRMSLLPIQSLYSLLLQSMERDQQVLNAEFYKWIVSKMLRENMEFRGFVQRRVLSKLDLENSSDCDFVINALPKSRKLNENEQKSGRAVLLYRRKRAEIYNTVGQVALATKALTDMCQNHWKDSPDMRNLDSTIGSGYTRPSASLYSSQKSLQQACSKLTCSTNIPLYSQADILNRFAISGRCLIRIISQIVRTVGTASLTDFLRFCWELHKQLRLYCDSVCKLLEETSSVEELRKEVDIYETEVLNRVMWLQAKWTAIEHTKLCQLLEKNVSPRTNGQKPRTEFVRQDFQPKGFLLPSPLRMQRNKLLQKKNRKGFGALEQVKETTKRPKDQNPAEYGSRNSDREIFLPLSVDSIVSEMGRDLESALSHIVDDLCTQELKQ